MTDLRSTVSRRVFMTGRSMLLLGVFLIAANLRAGITSVGPVVEDIQRDLGLSAFAVSALTSIPLLAFAFFSPCVPSIANRIGLERTSAAALLALAAGILIRSLTPVLMLWVGTAIIGAAIASLNVVLPALVKRDFPSMIGPVTGAYSAVQAVVAAVAVGITATIAANASLGWRSALAVWSIVAVLAFAGLVFPVKTRSIPEGTLDPASGQEAHRAHPWGSPIAWQVAAFMGLQSMFFYVLVAWLTPIDVAAGASPVEAGLHQSFLNLGSLVGSLACSLLLHRLRGQRLIVIIASVLMGGASLGLIWAPRWTSIWSWAAGIAGGVSFVLALSLFGLRTRTHHAAAALSGMAQSVGYALAATGPVLVGLLHDLMGGWQAPLMVLVLVSCCHLVFGLLASRSLVVDS